jgi:hypothetical protein
MWRHTFFKVDYLIALSVSRLYSVDYRMINERETVDGRRNGRTRRSPAPMQLCSPQITYDLIWGRTRAAAVGRTPCSLILCADIEDNTFSSPKHSAHCWIHCVRPKFRYGPYKRPCPQWLSHNHPDRGLQGIHIGSNHEKPKIILCQGKAVCTDSV